MREMLEDAYKVENVTARGDARAADGLETDGAHVRARDEDDVDGGPRDDGVVQSCAQTEQGGGDAVRRDDEAVVGLDECVARTGRRGGEKTTRGGSIGVAGWRRGRVGCEG